MSKISDLTVLNKMIQFERDDYFTYSHVYHLRSCLRASTITLVIAHHGSMEHEWLPAKYR